MIQLLNRTTFRASFALLFTSGLVAEIDENEHWWPNQTDGEISQRVWTIPDGFAELIAPQSDEGGERSIKFLLEYNGVSFADQITTRVHLLSAERKLIARNTGLQLKRIEELVKAATHPGEMTHPKERAKEEIGVTLLNSIVIAEFLLEDADLEDAIKLLRLKSLEHNPDKAPLTFSFLDPESSLEARKIKKLLLRDVPLRAALRYICDELRLQYMVKDRSVFIKPRW